MPYFGATTLADVLDEIRSGATPPASGKVLISTLNDRKASTRGPGRSRSGQTLEETTAAGGPSADDRPAETADAGRPPPLIVLIHGGHPWSHEAGYIASVLPDVHVDLSVLLPWAGWTAERLLSDLMGSVPASKLLYGSDQASEPEVFWIAARLARRVLERAGGQAGHVFNLGHGVLPQTDPDTLQRVVDLVHQEGVAGQPEAASG